MSEVNTAPEKNIDNLFKPAVYKEAEAERITYTNYAYWRSTFQVFLKNKMAVGAFILMVLLILFAYIQPYLPNQLSESYIYYIDDITKWRLPPNATHWFGTDNIGRDYWARVWFSVRISLSLALLVVATEAVIGIVVGTIWGYFRKMDRIMTEVYNFFTNIPSIILLILMTYLLRPSFSTVYIALSITGWIYMARFMRNQILIIRDREYNLASRCLGTPAYRMIIKNLLPHLVSVIIMRMAVAIPSTISAESVITFLGIGLPNDTPSLGVLLSNARSSMDTRPHLLFIPAVVMTLVTLTFYIAGNAFSDASDPRNHT